MDKEHLDNESILVNGSILEGGGQILRMSVSLGTIMGLPFNVSRIRAGRKSPGLKQQHLTGLKLVSDICSAELRGCEVNSQDILMKPKFISSGQYFADTHTAGSTMLLLQVAMPCLLFAKGVSTMLLRGGTNAEMAPQVDYTVMIFKRLAERFGANFDIIANRRGYFPRGGGEVEVTVQPLKAPLKPIQLTDPGKITSITGTSFVAGSMPFKLMHIMAEAAERKLQQELPGVNINITRVKEKFCDGSAAGIVLCAESSTGCIYGGSSLCKRNQDVKEVGELAAEEILRPVRAGSCVDTYAQDQLILLMALAAGKSIIRTGPLTLHTRTAIHVAELFTKIEFSVVEKAEGDITIECDGIGVSPRQS